jgi:hypothetical protein
MGRTVLRDQQAMNLLRRRGLSAASFEQLAGCPRDARSYLRRSNPKLLELMRSYEFFGGPVEESCVWCKDYLSKEVPFHAFRDDCAFIWQRRENIAAHYILSADWLLKGRWSDLFLKLSEDGLFGAQVVRTAGGVVVTRDRIDSTLEIAFLNEYFDIGKRYAFSVLDIGAGYGRLGYRMTEAFAHSEVICTDAIAESTFLCEYYLQMRGVTPRSRSVPLTEIENVLETARVDVAVNIHSFSECLIGAVKWWLSLLQRRRVPYLLIVPNSTPYGGQELLCFDGQRKRIDIRSAIGNAGYRRVACVPKYQESSMQRYGGVSPTYYHLFEFAGCT